MCARDAAHRASRIARAVCATPIVDGDASFVVHLPVSVSVSLCGVDVRARARATRITYATHLRVGRGIHPSMSMSMSIDVDVDRSTSIDGLRMRRTVERSNGRMRAAREGCVCVCVCLCVCVFSMDGWIGVDFTNHDQGRRRRRRRRGVSVGDVMSSDVMIMGKTDHGQ